MKALRISAVGLGMVLLAPAIAAASSFYSNSRFGYRIDIPSGFSTVRESANGDGGTAYSGATSLAVWGSYMTEPSLKDELKVRTQADVEQGWEVTYQRMAPDTGTTSGRKGDRVFYQRAIAYCGGTVAFYRLEYPMSQKVENDSRISFLNRSLSQVRKCK